MVNFKDLKKQSSASFTKLQGEIDKLKKTYSKDERFWTPTVNKEGVGQAVIRFLPAASGEEVPFVQIFNHGFKGPTGLWYIEKSLTTIGQKDPLGEFNSRLWNSTDDDDAPARKQARNQKRKLHFISNIYIVSDPGNPENEGKVFLYSYGKKIWDKINSAMHPEFEDEASFNPFDMWTGANFKLKIKNVDGFRNYNNSEFADVAPLSPDDDKLEAIWKQCYPLKPLIAPDQFKSYNELETKLAEVLGNSYRRSGEKPVAAVNQPVIPATVSNTKAEDEVDVEDLPWNTEGTGHSGDEDAMNFLKSLAE